MGMSTTDTSLAGISIRDTGCGGNRMFSVGDWGKRNRIFGVVDLGKEQGTGCSVEWIGEKSKKPDVQWRWFLERKREVGEVSERNVTGIQGRIDRNSGKEIRMEEKDMCSTEKCCCCHQKATPRTEQELKQLKNRLSRMAGQLNGIGKMLDENRYCGDILTQVAAVESALQAFGYVILQEHMKTCVVEEIKKGNTAIVDEAVELVKKLK